MRVNWIGQFQQFGRALMLPMIALPAAAILLSLGNLSVELFGNGSFSHILTTAGQLIFTYLPVIFAVGVAVGLSSGASTAGMAAMLSYFIVLYLVRERLGDYYELGVTGGILIGILSALAYHLLKNIKLPEYIQFFGGPRFVILFMGLFSVFISYGLIAVAPVFEAIPVRLGEWLGSIGGVGAFFYGFVHRLLVPFGLHHILNNVVWFQTGSFERADGLVLTGDLPRFFAGDPEAGLYMAGLYPIMMFALPAIAFAIIHEAREDLKPKVRTTFLIAALSSFLTGVTEPVEFAFLFVAPYLFIVHAALSGAAMWITYELGIRHGFSYSAGAIDFIINDHLSYRAYLLIPIGIAYGILYYVLFRWAIRRFKLPTPGREEGSELEDWVGDIPYRAPLILQALGGKNNIKQMEACITRLRLTLNQEGRIDSHSLRSLGAAGVIHLGGGNVQVVFGTYSELIREAIMKEMTKDEREIHLTAPMTGKMIPLDEVPDQVFSSKLVGEGVAFQPERGELVSPADGTIVHLHSSKHAVGIRMEEGIEILLHIGIDTVNLNGVGFTALVKEGDKVRSGDLLIKFDMQLLQEQVKSLTSPMVITNPNRVRSWKTIPWNEVKAGQKAIMSVIINKETEGGEQHDD